MTDNDQRAARLAALEQHVEHYVSGFRGTPTPAELSRSAMAPVELTSPVYPGALLDAVLKRRRA